MKKIHFLALALSFIGIGCSKQPDVFVDSNGVAINGYDPVAYFTDSKPVKGNSEFSLTHNNAIWHFSSQENKESFEKDPLRYSPQYGGYCAYGMSNGYKAPTSPDAWTVVGDKLYLNYNKEVQVTWSAEKDKRIPDADKNWGKLATSSAEEKK